MSKKSSRKAGRVVRYTRVDGTVVTKRYAPYQPKAKGPGRTVGDMIAGWERSPNWAKLAPRTQAQYQTYLRHLLVVEKAAVKDIKRAQLLDIRDAVMTAKGAGAAIAFARTTSAAFGWAVDRGWIEHSPAVRLQRDVPHGNLPAWTEGDVDLALTHLPEHLRRAVVLALYTGQRRGDLIAMPWTAYDGAHIRLTPEKTRRHQNAHPLVIPALPVLRRELDAWRPDIAGSSPILTTRFGEPWRLGSNLSKQLQDHLGRIPGFPAGRNIHGLRKLAATRLAEAGCNLQEIASITGHQTLAMIQLYTRSVDQARAAESASEKLARRLKGG